MVKILDTLGEINGKNKWQKQLNFLDMRWEPSEDNLRLKDNVLLTTCCDGKLESRISVSKGGQL